MDIFSLLLFNPIIWLILIVALPSYAVLLELLVMRDKSEAWFTRSQGWTNSLQTAVGALPLLGLLGTISGLLETFGLMSVSTLSQEALVSGGIADALLTTELGLLMAIPAWLMIAALKAQTKTWELQQCAQV